MRTCLHAICLALLPALSGGAAHAAGAHGAHPMAGIWKQELSCAGATSPYKERCERGERDEFRLAIQVSGNRICAIHAATAQLGNRVDEVEDLQPSMTGTVTGNTATVRFASAWGGTGTATLRIEGGVLHWKVSAKDGGESLVPGAAVLKRVAGASSDRLPECPARQPAAR